MNIDTATDLGFDEDGSSADRERYQDKNDGKMCILLTAQSINEDFIDSPTNISFYILTVILF